MLSLFSLQVNELDEEPQLEDEKHEDTALTALQCLNASRLS